jgi:hypothetical protein
MGKDTGPMPEHISSQPGPPHSITHAVAATKAKQVGIAADTPRAQTAGCLWKYEATRSLPPWNAQRPTKLIACTAAIVAVEIRPIAHNIGPDIGLLFGTRFGTCPPCPQNQCTMTLTTHSCGTKTILRPSWARHRWNMTYICYVRGP